MAQEIAHPSIDERRATGRQARERTPPSSHAGWRPAADRPDPVALLEEQNLTREPDLVPVRHGRMMVSPFTFYRGAAKIMAADLKDTPDGRPGRPAVRRRPPVELRRVRLAGADAGVRPERLRRDAARPVRVRREADGGELHDRGPQQRVLQGRRARGDARRRWRPTGRRWPSSPQMRTMDIWYAHLDEDELMAAIRSAVAPTKNGQGEEGEARQGQDEAGQAGEKRAEKTAAKAHTRDSLQALSKLGELVDGRYRIVSQPPIVVPARDLAATYGLSAGRGRAGDPRPVPRLPGHPAGRPAAPARAVRDRRRRPARSSASAASEPGRSSSCCRAATQQDPLFLQVKEATRLGARGPPAQEPLPAARASGSCRGSG